MDAFVTMPLRISATLAARIDEHWHAERLMSRAAAIRDILERGLSSQSLPRDPGHTGDDVAGGGGR
jgi:metal-responsive CopG/Arc/MetJ family transcriptional regulator